MNPSLHRLALIPTIIASIVIVLGSFVRLSHAGSGCPDWPGCQGELWPDANFRNGFVLTRDIGVDYEGGVLLISQVAGHSKCTFAPAAGQCSGA